MNFQKLASLILCLIMCMALCPVVSAATTPKIIVSAEAAHPGEEVTVDISITNNPGIMAMSFSVPYDSSCFEFVKCTKGFISTPTYKDHSDKGYVSFNVAETAEKSNAGTMLSVTFKVKDNATPGTKTITIGNHFYEKAGTNLSNCFANSKTEYIVPTVQSGSIRVKGPCDTTGHSFEDWTETKPANCTEKGTKERVCKVCKITEKATIPFTHNFEADWTVDKVATPEERGIMSRHCTNCDAVTDILTFTYEEIGGDDDSSTDEPTTDIPSDDSSDDTSSDGVSPDDTTSDDSTTSEDTPSDNQSSKPNIDNTEGAKNPLSEVEKLEGYENIKPSDEEPPQENPDDNTSSQTNSSNSTSSNSVPTDNSDTQTDKAPSFLSTASGIITLILCILLSCGIIALAIILILKSRKSN